MSKRALGDVRPMSLASVYIKEPACGSKGMTCQVTAEIHVIYLTELAITVESVIGTVGGTDAVVDQTPEVETSNGVTTAKYSLSADATCGDQPIIEATANLSLLFSKTADPSSPPEPCPTE